MTKNREKKIYSVTLWGAVANILLSFAKFVAGTIGKSSAMMADAIHSLSDVVSDVIVLAMVKLATKGKDKGHDYGHAKFETLATLAVSLLLIVAGGKLLSGGIEKIRMVIEGGSIDTPGKIALWAALLSIVVKELLFQWTAKIGRDTNSPAVVSNAWHHRTDALSSIGSALGIGAAILFGGQWAILDPLVGCGISIFIFYIAVTMAMPALAELTEASLPDEVENDLHDIIMGVEGVDDVHAIKSRKAGPNIIFECHLVVNPEMSVADAHRITSIAESRIREKYGQETQISLHIEPDVESD